MEWCSPFPRRWYYVRDITCVAAVDVFYDGAVIREENRVVCADDVMDAEEGRLEAVWGDD